MDWDKLKIFHSVAKAGSFTNAAKHLNTSQSALSRQIKSYIEIAHSGGYRVIKTLLVAPEFSEDFEKECREEFELNLSLITADTLVAILNGFKTSKHKIFPYKLLMKDVLIKEDWIIKAINK